MSRRACVKCAFCLCQIQCSMSKIICVDRPACSRPSGRLFPRSCLKVASTGTLFNIIHILLDHTRINPKEKISKIHICCRRTLGQAAHAQSRVSVGAVSPGQELHRWQQIVIFKMCGKLLKLAKQIYSFDFPVVYENICCQQEVNFRTYDNLASYEPGNMEYRGRAYSTEVGAVSLCII